MLSRKGALAEGAIFWIIYILMTGIIIFMIRTIPSTVYSQVTETGGIENAILTERVYNKVSWESPLTGRNYPGELQTRSDFDIARINRAFDTLNSPRQLSFKLALDGKTAFYNEQFYKIAKPLSPVRYTSFVENRPVWINDEKKVAQLQIDQVFAPSEKGGII